MTTRISWPVLVVAGIIVCLAGAVAAFALSGGDHPAAAAPGPTATASPGGDAQPPAATPSRTPVPHTIIAPPGAITSLPAGPLPIGGGATDRGRPPSYYIAELLPHTTAFEGALIQDGELTRDEYETAIFATIQCVADNGFVVVGPNYDNQGFLVYQFATKDTALGGQFSLVSDSCSSQYSRDVSTVWSSVVRQSLPPPAVDPDVQKAIDLAYLSACLTRHGIPQVPPGLTDFQQLRQALVNAGRGASDPLLVECQWEYSEALGTPRPKEMQ